MIEKHSVRMPRRLETLDAIRGIAAIATLLYHTQIRMGGAPVSAASLSSAYLAVDLFFGISGYIMARKYEEGLAAGILPWHHFMAMRVKRLWPLYLASLAIGIDYAIGAGITAREGIGAGMVAAAVLLIPLRSGSQMAFPINPASWSLSLEFVANAVFARWGCRVSTRSLAWLCATTGVCLAGVSVAGDGLDFGWGGDNFEWGLLRTAFSYGAGHLVFRLEKSRRIILPQISAGPLLATVVAIMLFPARDLGLAGPWDAIMAVAIFPMLLALACASRPPQVMPGVFAWTGRISYALYIAQRPVEMWIVNTAAEIDGYPFRHYLLSALAIIALTLCVSHLLCVADETLRTIMTRLSARPLKAATGGAECQSPS